jgi:transcription-repair coupling factor (superfamily II helicase)
MQAVGFDLYARLLDSSVRELKGEAVARDVPAQVSLGLESFLPDWWASDGRTKLEVYKRLAGCESEDELHKLRGELQDRLGREPREVSFLFESARVRILATPLGMEGVKRGGRQVLFSFRARGDLDAVVRGGRQPGRRTGDRTWVLPVPDAPDLMMAAVQGWLRGTKPAK